MKRIVVLQPQFFPWVGVFEQIRLADVFIHFDDVQLPQGRSFTSRVQIKTPQGSRWLTAPIVRRSGQRIDEAELDERQAWRERHLSLLNAHYAAAPFAEEMLDLVAGLYSRPIRRLAELNIAGLERIADYFDLRPQFALASAQPSEERSSQRIVNLVRAHGGDVYLTGHGARNYLDHELFEQHGIRVEYIDYQRIPYQQLHGDFEPHVSILDVIANLGVHGGKVLCSRTVPWRKFAQRKTQGAAA